MADAPDAYAKLRRRVRDLARRLDRMAQSDRRNASLWRAQGENSKDVALIHDRQAQCYEQAAKLVRETLGDDAGDAQA